MTAPLPNPDRAFIERSIRIAIIGVTTLAVVMALLFVLEGALTPLALSLGIAYLLDPAVTALERRGLPRRLGVLVLLALALVVLALALLVVVPELARQLRLLAQSLPGWIDALLDWAVPRLEALGVAVPASWAEAFRELQQRFGIERLGGLVQGFVSGVTGTLGAVLGVLVVPVIAYYLLAEFAAVKAGAVSVIPPRFREGVLAQVRRVDTLLSGFVRGQLTVCALLGTLYAVGFAVIGVPAALLIGIVSGTIAFVPYVGSAVALTSAAFACLFEYGLGLRLLAVVGWYVLVQNLEGFVLTPRIVGRSVGMHPVTVIVALLIGGNLLGFLGLLVAVPLAAVVQVFVRELLDLYRRSDVYTGGPGDPA